MKRKLFVNTLLVICLLALGTAGTQAQDIGGETDRQGSTGGAYLLVPVTAQSVALGSVTGASSDISGLEALTTNPGNLILNQGTGVMFSRMSYVADIGINHFGVAQQVGSNQLALSVTSWDYGDIPKTTENNPEPDNEFTFSASNIVVGLSYARLFTDRISGGLTAKVVNQSIGDDLSAGTVAFDAGIGYTAGSSGLRFGVSLNNLAPALAFDGDGLERTGDVQEDRTENAQTVTYEAAEFELPAVLNVGASYTRPFGAAEFTVISNFRSDPYFNNNYSLGAEVGIADVIDFRGSYVYDQDIEANFYEGWNLGAGLQLDVAGTQLAVDYAYRLVDVSVMGDVHIFTASVML